MKLSVGYRALCRWAGHVVCLLVSVVLVDCGLVATAEAQETPGAVTASAEVDFALDVLPVLSDKCFVCHGPDTPADIDLRLDLEEHAVADRGGYRAIDSDDPERSEVLVRIESADDPMPPVDAEKQLTDEEKAILRAWIEQGGNYEQHWAFVPPRKELPKGVDPSESGAIIDALVQERLKERGLDFASAADQSTLARRASLVLTGLPPSGDRWIDFIHDDQPGAYERYVDRLLESPAYGEHQARYWLDAVRYGDTHGLHLDNRRGIYPYRDWVVRAFNQNLPLDEFITWQLAGDLLPDPTLDQQIATGFVRLNPTTSEGGVIPAEFQAKNNFDRTETLGTVLLGMTLTCARCHTHKYDPITQTEYYRLLAFFNSTAENPLDGNAYAFGPTLRVPENQEAWSQWQSLLSQRDELLAEAAESLPAGGIIEYAGLANQFSSEHWRRSPVGSMVGDEPGESRDEWVDYEQFPADLQIKSAGKDEACWLVGTIHTKVSQTLRVEASGFKVTRILVDGKPAGGQSLALGSDGSHVVAIRIALDEGEKARGFGLKTDWHAVAEGGDWGSLSVESQLALVADEQGPFEQETLGAGARELAAEMSEAQSRFTTTLVARDLGAPRATKVLRRGEYDMPVGEALEPEVPSVMGLLPEDAPRNRLGLARWLTSPEHPLVARVLVNRMWQEVFGAGLVRTPEDFGVQGSRPTHPQLLDWLAVELQESGWDMKHVLRLMVTSRTFKQSSAWRSEIDDPENRWLARGPRYRLDAEVIRDIGLWASELLDPTMGGEGVKPYQPPGMWQAMAHPASNTKKYERDEGDKLYRRSLYVYWKRTSPHPMMTLFDAPDRESSCVRRSRTSTPLQSLGLLNETQRIEMARKFAERLIMTEPTDIERVQLIFYLLAVRSPTDNEERACLELFETMKKRYRDSIEDAEALLATGDEPRNEDMDPVAVAAWTQVCITVLASDVAIMLY